MDLSTKYLGFDLPHPFVVGASPYAAHLDIIKQLEDAGMAMFVMNSLFEEQIIHHETGVEHHIERHQESFAEAVSYYPGTTDFHLGPDQYLEQIQKIKEVTNVPVVASLNGSTEGSWVEYSRLMEEAGADALELNLYFLPTSDDDSSSVVEQRVFQIVRLVRQTISIPIAVKLSPFFTSLMQFAGRIEETGANALVIFNRFYQPDIDIEELEIKPQLKLSNSEELLLRLRWIAVLYKKFKLDLSLTGGVHTPEDAVKAIMAGSDSLQIVSALLERGPGYLKELREGTARWMEEHEYESLQQMKGSMSYTHSPNPEAIERANYLKILQSWKP